MSLLLPITDQKREEFYSVFLKEKENIINELVSIVKAAKYLNDVSTIYGYASVYFNELYLGHEDLFNRCYMISRGGSKTTKMLNEKIILVMIPYNTIELKKMFKYIDKENFEKKLKKDLCKMLEEGVNAVLDNYQLKGKSRQIIPMREFLNIGEPEEKYKELDIKCRKTYQGKEFSVCEVTEEEYRILCNHYNSKYFKVGSGIESPVKPSVGKANKMAHINNKEIKIWLDNYPKENGHDCGEFVPEFDNLMEYLLKEIECSSFDEIHLFSLELARQNKMKLSELFRVYQD